MPVGDGRPRLRRGRTGIGRIRPRGAVAGRFHGEVGMEAATQQDQIAQALRADSWGGRDGWKKRLAPNGAARPMSQFNEARKRLHARKEEQNEAESRECPAGVAIYCDLFSTRPPRARAL